VVEALLDCHDRIRHFAEMARRLAEAHDAPPGEVAEAARQVHRYFSLALPLHAEDEEESVLPRLRGKDAALDAELARMHEEHGRIEVLRERLVTLCADLKIAPGRLDLLRSDLEDCARRLELLFEQHLGQEERQIFPAITRLLSADEQRQIQNEIRARRGQFQPRE
jgi:hemerythrin-like domain-containing protein